jgi:purine-cytosine permease-like protein
VFGGLALVLGLMGPVGVVRRVVRTVGVWTVPLALAYLAWWALDGGGLDAAWSAPGEGGLSVWQGADIVVAVTVSWIPLAADYTRFCRTPRGAFWGTGVGYLVPDLLLLSLGAVLLFTRDVSDAAALPPAVAAGGLGAFLALLALTVAETDEAFANAYSGAVSSQNLFPWAPQRALVVVTTSLGVLGALTIDLLSFQTFLLLLGSVFVPLFGVLLADWLVAGRRYEEADIFGAPPWRPAMIAVWLLGFAVYQWLAPTGPDWWVELVGRLDPPSWGIGATIPSFAVTVAAGLAVAWSARKSGLRAVGT